MDVYRPSLLDVRAHKIWCGDASGYKDSSTTKAEYVTRINGVVIVESDHKAAYKISFSRNGNCGRWLWGNPRPLETTTEKKKNLRATPVGYSSF